MPQREDEAEGAYSGIQGGIGSPRTTDAGVALPSPPAQFWFQVEQIFQKRSSQFLPIGFGTYWRPRSDAGAALKLDGAHKLHRLEWSQWIRKVYWQQFDKGRLPTAWFPLCPE